MSENETKLTKGDFAVYQAVRDELAFEACKYGVISRPDNTMQIRANWAAPLTIAPLSVSTRACGSGVSVDRSLKRLAEAGLITLYVDHASGELVAVLPPQDLANDLHIATLAWWEAIGYAYATRKPRFQSHRFARTEDELRAGPPAVYVQGRVS